MKCSDYSWRAAQIQKEYGVELQPWQEEILQNWDSPRLLVKAARRTGKDTLGALLAMELVKSGFDVVIACGSPRSVESMREAFDQISKVAERLTRPTNFSAFEVTNHRSDGQVNRITVTSRIERGLRANVGIANEAGWMTSFQLDDLEKVCDRMMLISSWPPDPDSTRFGWLWRYGGLKWQRLEVPADLDWAREQADGLTSEVIHDELLRSPSELGRN